MLKKVAVFDFDHTLIAGDSFWPFLIYAAGRMRTYAALVEGVALFAAAKTRKDASDSMRTFLKSHLLRRLIAGEPREHLAQAARRTRLWQKFNPSILPALRDHHAEGTVIVIASGGLDLYLPEMLRDVPHDVLICTNIGVVNNVATGEMVQGNCVRLRKAERVAEWLAAQGPFGESFGYGNYPDDVPMLNLLQHRIIVS